jgi:UDP-N-acetylmuramoylalanine--D-glutamate ligase
MRIIEAGMVDWKDKHMIVVGAARQGISLGHFLATRGATVVMNDRKPAEQMGDAIKAMSDLDASSAARVEWAFGGHPVSLLEDADYVCVSGGVSLDIPLIREALKLGIPLTNDSQVFLEECPCKSIGITGSAGKTTTTSLVGKIVEKFIKSPQLKPLYRKVWVGGNIGAPLLSDLDEMQPSDLAVIELSSFQLELMTRSVDIACVLNITPNHLDRHASMDDYIAAKKRIIDYQAKQAIAVLGRDDPVAWYLRGAVQGKLFSFGRAKPSDGVLGAFMDGDWLALWDGSTTKRILKQSQIPLRGWHNVENILAACAISQAAGIHAQAMREAILEFSGVPHRLEKILSCNGVDWYNDSIATAPERVIAAIHAFESPEDIHRPIVLLAGGRDKNLPWDNLAELIHHRVDHLILFGEAADKINVAVGPQQSMGRPLSIARCSGLEQAVEAAASVVEPGDIVLLSPGGTSFDEFRDFEDRGEAFRRWVHNLSCM